MTTLRMLRIPVPDWAPSYYKRGAGGEIEHELWSEAGVEAYEALKERRAELFAVADAAVNEYVNNDGLTEEEDGVGHFPNRQRLSGKYWISEEGYDVGDDGDFFVSIMARCLERAWGAILADPDYLGLDVWIDVSRETGAITVSMVSSSSI